MKRPIPLNTATLLVPNLINHSRLRRGFPVVLFALGLALFALPQSAKAADGAVGDGTSTAEGTGALRSLSSGIYDTAMGFQALYSNTSGVYNTATGATALHDNSTGYENTATGTFALFNNTIGTDNTATGFEALVSNTDGG